MEIEKSQRDENAILSSDEFTDLENRIKGHIETIKNTDAAVKKAESERVTAENARVKAESERAAAEKSRQENENTRIQQEKQRQQDTSQAVKTPRMRPQRPNRRQRTAKRSQTGQRMRYRIKSSLRRL